MGVASTPTRWLRRMVGAADHAVSGAVLMREAARTSRRWQTYAARAAFSGTLMGVLLAGMWTAVQTANSGVVDAAHLGWAGRALFVGFSVTQLALAVILAPLMTATAIIEETEEGTMELLALTRLRPAQILGAKVMSRLLVLFTVVCGALPIMALVVNLGGVSTVEVVAVTVHTLTTLVLMGALGAFFALFTRSPTLSMMASACYGLPFFAMVPMAYVLCTGDIKDAAHLSPLAGSTVQDWSALVAPLSYLPALAVIAAITTPLFQLKVSNADFHHAFSEPVWRTAAWVKGLLGWIAVSALTVPPAALACWTIEHSKNTLIHPVVDWSLQTLATGWLWALFTVAVAMGTWVYLRLGMDVVDGIDGVFSRPTSATDRPRAVNVGGNPVWWREARPRAWGSTAAPVFVTWSLVMLAVFQTGWWVLPGGLLATGVLNCAAALVLSVWMSTRAIAEERRRGTLEVLLVTTLPSWRILAGKVAGIALPTLPMVLLSLPLLVLGVPHLHALMWFGSGGGSSIAMGEWALRGALAWLWFVPIWCLAITASLAVAMRIHRPRAAFGVMVVGILAALTPPTLAGRLFPDLWLIAVPSRLVAPPLAGQAEWWQLAVSIPLIGGLALVMFAALTRWMRPWAGKALAVLLALLLAPSPAWAQPTADEIAALEKRTGIRLRAEPILDGLVRPDRWTALAVTVENAGPATTGEISLEERASGSTEMRRWTRNIELAEGARKQVLMLFQPSTHTRPRVLDLTTRDGRTAAWVFAVTQVPDDAVTVGVIGTDPVGLNALSDTWARSVPGRIPRGRAEGIRDVRMGLVPGSAMPRQSAAWGTPDWLVWPQADPSALSQAQMTALASWVADGGHLLLTVTDTWKQVQDSELARALPVTFDGQRDAEVGPLLQILGGTGDGTAPIARARRKPDRTAWVRAQSGDGHPLWISGPYGTGSMHVLTANLRVSPLTLLDRRRAWRKLLSLPATDAVDSSPAGIRRAHTAEFSNALHLDPAPPWSPSNTWEYDGPVDGWFATVRGRLSAIPGVAPLPFSWLLLFCGTYLLVIGPLDYGLLRLLGRQPMTWITFPISIALFSAVALVGTSYTKGSQAVLTRVEVIDVLPDADLWRGDTFLGVFATRKTQLDVRPSYPDSVISPMRESGFMTDADIQSGSGGASASYSAETWTLAYLRSSWTTPAEGRLILTPVGDQIEITNEMPIDFEHAAVWVGASDHVSGFVDVGPLPQGATAMLEHRPDVSSLPGGTEDDLSFALSAMHPSGLDLGRGALGIEFRDMTFVGTARTHLAPMSLTGLAPVQQPLLVVRQPMLATGTPLGRLEARPIEVRFGGDLSVDRVQLSCPDAGIDRSLVPLEDRAWFGGVPAEADNCSIGLVRGKRSDWQSVAPGMVATCAQNSLQSIDCIVESL